MEFINKLKKIFSISADDNSSLKLEENVFKSNLSDGLIHDNVNDVICKLGAKNYKPCNDCTALESLMKLNGALLESFLARNGYTGKLALKKSQLVYKDDYGDIVEHDWIAELDRFIINRYERLNAFSRINVPNYLVEYCKENDCLYLIFQNSSPDFENLREGIDWEVEMYTIDNDIPIENDYYEDITPEKFEYLFSQHLNKLGWEANTTKASGDQGADVVAEKNGLRLVAQCKLYSSPVGNSAVQEVFSAKEFYKADIAVVVTNNNFTKSAKQLAESTGVFLIHYTQTEDFDNLIFGDS